MMHDASSTRGSQPPDANKTAFGGMLEGIKSFFSFGPSPVRRVRSVPHRQEEYRFDLYADWKDPVDQEMAAFLKAYPKVYHENIISKVGERKYRINERVIDICLAHNNRMMIVDGPLQQPFADYMLGTGQNEVWNSQEQLCGKAAPKTAAISQVPVDHRMTFGDVGNPCGDEVGQRLKAMKDAHKQSKVRIKDAQMRAHLFTDHATCNGSSTPPSHISWTRPCSSSTWPSGSPVSTPVLHPCEIPGRGNSFFVNNPRMYMYGNSSPVTPQPYMTPPQLYPHPSPMDASVRNYHWY
eukprot:GHVL01021818.1.p1 GENE.GHVL01021818.1~~GHVL01021818.1.p1  ORF type:complete len:295 (+),score=31.65 GHVL01021818.1:124-1008(+)